MEGPKRHHGRLTRANPIPYPAVGAWSLWFVAACMIDSKYLEQHSAARWPAIVYWLMVIVSPYAYYRYRDETFVACIAVLMVMTAMMLGN